MPGRIAQLVLALSFTIGGLLLQLPVARAQEDPVRVVSTFSILTDLIEEVGGELVQVDTLVPSNMDAHAFEPSPEQVTKLTDAAVIFENGLGFEQWLDRMIEAANPRAERIAVSDGVPLRSSDGERHDPGDPDEAEHDHGEIDPHIWQDPVNVMTMVENIRDALATIDPDNAAVYEANATAYLAELEELDRWIAELVESLPQERRKLVTSHDTFGYFADRYGFEVIGTPLGGSTESAEPAAREIAELIETIRAADVPAIFTENVINLDVMEQIASNAGVELAPPLYTDSLGEPGSPGETYLSMMRYNAETIVNALAA